MGDIPETGRPVFRKEFPLFFILCRSSCYSVKRWSNEGLGRFLWNGQEWGEGRGGQMSELSSDEVGHGDEVFDAAIAVDVKTVVAWVHAANGILLLVVVTAATTPSRSGLSVTAAMGDQFRVCRLQRAGCFARAAW